MVLENPQLGVKNVAFLTPNCCQILFFIIKTAKKRIPQLDNCGITPSSYIISRESLFSAEEVFYAIEVEGEGETQRLVKRIA